MMIQCKGLRISAQIVKENLKFFTKILTPLFNKSIIQDIFAEQLKIATNHKSGEKDYTRNHKSISSISIIISKVFKLCVKEKSGSQFGFTRGKSAGTALFRHITEIENSVEKNNFVMEVYLDLAKVSLLITQNFFRN